MTSTFFLIKKIRIYFMFLAVSVPFTVKAQGFFMDHWEPKIVTNPQYLSAAATTSTPTVTVTVDAANILTKVSPLIYGHNAAVWGGKIELNTALMTDVTNLNPGIIRWPGGNMSNDYFWDATSQATCPNDLPPTAKYNVQLYGALKTSWTMPLDSYYSMLQKTNSTGIICVNYAYARYGTSSDPVAKAANYAANWVRYDNGRTRYWEIGNENYGNWETGYVIDQSLNKDGQPATISGDLYGRHCKIFIDSMRAAAKEVGTNIKIGVVVYNHNVKNVGAPSISWNEGVMKQVAAKADFLIPHFYFGSPTDVNVATILNTATTDIARIKTMLNNQLKTNAGLNTKPIALTEWNINSEGQKQQVSFINGIHGTIVLGELIKNKYGQSSRWDFLNGWSNGDNHGLFADGDYGMTKYTPRAPFFYPYYFQKFFGDNMVASTVTGTDSVLCYASTFSSGQSGVVLVNKGKLQRTINLKMNNFNYGKRYYYYLLTGGQDSTFSRKVFINGHGPTQNGGGPASYSTLQPYGTDILGGTINLTMPKYSVLFVLVEKGSLTTITEVQKYDNSISIYQNATSDAITINVKSHENHTIQLIDLSGIVFFQKKSNTLTINKKNIKCKGICLARIIGKDYVKTMKLIVK